MPRFAVKSSLQVPQRAWLIAAMSYLPFNIETMHLHKKACQDSTDQDAWASFRKARNAVRKTVRYARSQYHNSIISDSLSKSPKTAWNEIKKLVHKVSASSPTCLKVNDQSLTSSSAIANAFNKHFASICKPISGPSLESSAPNASTFVMPPTTPDWVLQQLANLPPGKAVGLDGISGSALKAAAPVIAVSVSELFNFSLSSGIYPSIFKKAKVIPIHKSGITSDPNNFRPISILPILSKILERFVCNALTQFIDSNELLYVLQSGFRKNYSCTTAMINLYDSLLSAYNRKKFSGLLLIDFSKAFDRVNHRVLLHKLKSMGICNPWFANYLCDRSQCVSFNGILSDFSQLDAGVPQGSVLGPLLFCCLINDLPSLLPDFSTCHMFADDCNIVVEGSSSVDVQTKLDSVAESCLAWASTSCLILNNAKTKTMLIRPSKRICFDDSFVVHMAGNPLVNVASAKILGIFLCSDIGNVNLTVDYTCKKIDTALFFIHNASKFVNSR